MSTEPKPSEPTASPSPHDGKRRDLEPQDVDLTQPNNGQVPVSDAPSSSDGDDGLGFADNSKVPRLSYPRLFWFFFYNFGLFAWGGPVAQIALIKEKLVIQDMWITLPRFQRVFSVYQILPGPEAAELCMFFGCLSAGRVGGILAGLAFMLPGLVLMLLASYLYSLAGLENKYFNASFRALQPVVAAMVQGSISPISRLPKKQRKCLLTFRSVSDIGNKILRAAHKIADHSVRKHDSKKVDPFLVIAAICTATNMALRINLSVIPIRPG